MGRVVAVAVGVGLLPILATAAALIIAGLAVSAWRAIRELREDAADGITDPDDLYLSSMVRACLNGSEGYDLPIAGTPTGEARGVAHPAARHLFGSPIHASLSGTTGARDNV